MHLPLGPHEERQVPESQERTVDVIVPVYRGLVDTQECVRSVLASACSTPFRLIVINDASPEPEVTQWLRALVGQDERYELLENEHNLGFVGTVNRGMALHDGHDVLLLNSDAMVANDWLDRLQQAAYSSPDIASVTPFSNNATICSYPRFCEDNELPNGFDTARLDRIFSDAFPGVVLDVPTGIGFCMYIRRDCLAQVGFFDEKNFGKGYGEENDFCRRAAAMGLRNLHALDTFVRHAGGVSFGSSKSPREQAAMETLRRLHPSYEPTVHRFVAQDPARVYRYRADLDRVRAAGLPLILAVLHDRGGGTLRHVDELAEHLRDHAIFFRLTPAPGQKLVLSLVGRGEAFTLKFQLPNELDALIFFLKNLNIRHIHFHHVLGHTAETLDLPSRLNVSFDFTAHDFYAICPQISLTDKRNSYCGEHGIEQCTSCLIELPAPGGIDIKSWRRMHHEFLSRARHILTPSVDAASRLTRFFPDLKISVAPHTDLQILVNQPILPPTKKDPANAPLKIAVLGALSPIKGADILEDAVTETITRRALIEFHVLGYTYRNLRKQGRGKLTIHGKYKESELLALLEKLEPDLIWFPAQWPETYSYTLSAALESGIPIVAPAIGAFPERLNGRAWTWIRPWDTTPSDWITFFEKIRLLNFSTGTSPPKTWFATESGTASSEWNYQEQYLCGLAPPSGTGTISLEFLQHHQAIPGTNPGSTSQGMRQKILTALVHLRATPGLSYIARSFPMRWQTRIKSWLRA